MTETIIHILSAALLLLLAGTVAGRAVYLSRRGVKVFLFASTDKGDLLLVPLMAGLFYTAAAGTLGLPMPKALGAPLWHSPLPRFAGVALCAASLVWLWRALVSFGESFRVGIDVKAPGGLITTGVFAVSRNPVYVGFLGFFTGMLAIYPNLALAVIGLLLFAAIHRQVLREEKFLRSHYGGEYDEYARRVRRYL